MSVIYKYPVFLDCSITVRHGQVVHFGPDPSGQLCVWVHHYDDGNDTTEFYIVGTGHEFNTNHIAHGSTIDGSFVWHLIEKWEDDEEA